MRALIIGLVISFVILIGCLLFIFKSLDANDEKFKHYVGEQVVVNGDTLTITDYSQIFENYTLSNGTKVSYEFVDKQLTPKTKQHE